MGNEAFRRDWCIFKHDEDGNEVVIGRYKLRESAEDRLDFWCNKYPVAWVNVCHIRELEPGRKFDVLESGY